MKYFIFTIIALLTINFQRVVAQNQNANAEVNFLAYITELQTESEDSKSEEFAEIFLATVNHVELSIYYQPAGSDNTYKKAEVNAQSGYGRLLFSNYLFTESNFSGGLSSSGGSLHIVHNQEIIDSVSWGNEDLAEDGLSYKRVFDEDGSAQICNLPECNNLIVSNTPSPEDSYNQFVIKEDTTDDSEDDPVLDDSNETDEEDMQDDKNDAPIEGSKPANPQGNLFISELFPDPESPMTDSEDEFFEIVNTSNQDINLAGVKLISGSKSNVVENLDGVIKAGSYNVYFAKDINLSLVNSGMEAFLVFNDAVIDSVIYPDAQSGLSYQLVNNEWVWSEPTPGQVNVGSGGQDLIDNELQNSGSALFLNGSSPHQDEGVLSSFAAQAKEKPEQIDYFVLASVGLVTVVYLIYEYRRELTDSLQRFGRHIRSSQKDRVGSSWWRSNRVYQRCRRWKDYLRERIGFRSGQ